MFESTIINEMSGTFLLINSQKSTTGYEIKMFQNNDIKGFLPIELTSMNNIITYRYKIMEYESLTKRFYNTMFNIEDIKQVFLAIAQVGKAAEEYLLNPDDILLSPEYIFVKSDELLFCYYPENEQSFICGIRRLMEYILERLNHDNQENVMMAYGLYQKILKNNFTMEMLMDEFYVHKEEQRIILSKEIRTDENNKPLEIKVIQNGSNNADNRDGKYFDGQDRILDIMQLEEELAKSGSVKKNKTAKTKEKNNSKKGSYKKKTLFELFVRKKQDTDSAGPVETMLLAEDSGYTSTRILNCKVLKNQGNGRDIVLSNFPILIGNNSGEAGCKLENIMVSRRHAILTWECGVYYVEDQGSTNGTFVNGSLISPYEPVQIKEGDLVSFANESFRLN